MNRRGEARMTCGGGGGGGGEKKKKGGGGGVKQKEVLNTSLANLFLFCIGKERTHTAYAFKSSNSKQKVLPLYEY